MRAPAGVVQTVGDGPDLVLLHGTAADGSSWRPLVRLLRDRVRVTSFDRRGTTRWPVTDGVEPPSTQEHAADAADVILGLGAGAVHVCGASFGGVVALELMRSRPDLVRGAALFEPAVAPDDRLPAVPAALLAEFDRLVSEGKGPEAAESFHRQTLSDPVWERLPEGMKGAARHLWRQIRCDLSANRAYRVRYRELSAIEVPVLLLRGGRSRPVFEASLRALHAALPRSRLDVVATAGHQLHGRAWSDLAVALAELMRV